MSQQELADWLGNHRIATWLDDDGWIIEAIVLEDGAEGFHRIVEATHLVELGINDPKFSDAEFQVVKDLKSLRILGLSRSKVTGHGLRALVDLPCLEQFMYAIPEAADEGLAYLGQITSLKELNVGYSADLSDIGLASLSHLSNLESLAVHHCQIDAGISVVSQMPKLKILKLDHTNVGDETLKIIGQSRLLTMLRLSNHITDDGIAHLAELKSMEHFAFGGSVTEKSIEILAGWPNLSHIKLTNARLTPAAIRSLVKLKKLETLYIHRRYAKSTELRYLTRNEDRGQRVHIILDE